MAPAKTSKAKGAAGQSGDLDRQIVDRAVALADEAGWEQVRLRRVAQDLGLPLPDLLARYRDLDAVADAWFRRPLAAMVAVGSGEGDLGQAAFAGLPARERVYLVMMRWFEAQSEHRVVVGQMLETKLYPSHPHHWVPMIFNLSRLIQWVREAACLDAPGRRRQVEEVGLTLLFLAALRVWLRDESADLEATRRFLRGRLGEADRLLAAFTPPSRRRDKAAAAQAG